MRTAPGRDGVPYTKVPIPFLLSPRVWLSCRARPQKLFSSGQQPRGFALCCALKPALFPDRRLLYTDPAGSLPPASAGADRRSEKIGALVQARKRRAEHQASECPGSACGSGSVPPRRLTPLALKPCWKRCGKCPTGITEASCRREPARVCHSSSRIMAMWLMWSRHLSTACTDRCCSRCRCPGSPP